MRVLFDTNVLLDVLLARQPFAEVAVRLLSLADRGRIQGVICATTLTTIHYLATKVVGWRQAEKHIREILSIFEVAPVDRNVLERALEMRLPDYEDAVLHEAGRVAAVAGIVTRNGKDFAGGKLHVFTPDELLSAALAPEA